MLEHVTHLARFWWACSWLQTRVYLQSSDCVYIFSSSPLQPPRLSDCKTNNTIGLQKSWEPKTEAIYFFSLLYNFPSLDSSSETVRVAFWPLHKSLISFISHILWWAAVKLVRLRTIQSAVAGFWDPQPWCSILEHEQRLWVLPALSEKPQFLVVNTEIKWNITSMTIFTFLVYLMKNGVKDISKDKMAYRKKLGFLAMVNFEWFTACISTTINHTL